MRNFFTQGQTNNDSATEQARRSSLMVVHCNKHIASAGRITTTYIVDNDIVEQAPEEVSYYLLPDPYAGTADGGEYYNTVPDNEYY